MKRRRLLALCGTSLVPVAGCVGGEDLAGGTVEPTPTRPAGGSADSPGPERTPAREPVAVTVDAATVQPAYVTATSPDSWGVRPDSGTQYVFVTVDTERRSPPRSAVRLAVDETTYRPGEPDHDNWGQHRVRGRPYDAEEHPRGWLRFGVSATLGSVRAVALSWPGGRTPLGREVVRRLQRPPTTFEVADLAVPAAVTSGEPVTVSVTVANVGDHAGQFLGALNRAGPRIAYAPIERFLAPVEAGATRTLTYEETLSVEWGEGPREARYHLDWARGRESRTLTVVESE